jgi:hypothetical protein
LAFQRRIPPTDGRYVAARTLDFGDWKVNEGELFPWRERGMDEREVQRRWWIGELEAAPQTDVQPVAQAESVLAVYNVTPGESISVRTPEQGEQQKLTRAERRALRRQG